MTRIGKIRRVNPNKVKYKKGLDDFLPRAMKNPPPEYNILTQTALSMKTKIKDGEVNYYSHSITMDSDSGATGNDNRSTAYILHTTKAFVVELVGPKFLIKGFGGTRSPLINKRTL